MVERFRCPFCGGKFFEFAEKNSHSPDDTLTCPDCKASFMFSHLPRYENLKAQEMFRS